MEVKKNKIMQAILDNKFSYLAFAASAFVMIIVYYCNNVIPFGDNTVLRMDLYHQYGPLFAELYDRITQGESLVYSWNTGLGSSFLGNFGNYLASPLAIVMLILGHENMPEAIGVMMLLKAGFASAFFSYYLRKTTGKNDFSIAAFGVLYSFCGFFLAYYWNIMWIDAMALFPLIMYGIERIIKYGKFKTYLFSLAVAMLSNYYMAYIICAFSVIYFLVVYFSNYSLIDRFNVTKYVDSEGNKIKSKIKNKDKKFNIFEFIFNLRFINAGVRFAFASIAAAGIAAILLLPVYFVLQGCSATSDKFPEEPLAYFKIFDFIANHLNSVTPTIRSSGEDVLPNVYCGVISAMLAPLYLYSKRYTTREKAGYVIILALLFFSFNHNMLNFIWHGFHFPNDLPYRLSYIYSFILLTMAFKAIAHIKDYTPKMLLTVGISALAFIIIAEKVGSKNVTQDTVYVSIIFVVLYTLVIIMMNNNKYQTSAVALLLFCCVVSEASIGNTPHYVMQQPKVNYADDYDKFVTLKKKLDKKEGDNFYRMELTDLRARMDPSWYDYNGVSIFSSMAYETTSNLIRYLGVDGNFINSYSYNGFQTPVFNMMMSLKYIVDNTASTPTPAENLYTSVGQVGKFKAYENKYNLNIGYCVDKSILDWNYSDDNPFNVQNDYFERATGIKDVFTQIPVTYVDYDNINEFSPFEYESGEFIFFRSINDVDSSFTLCYEITESKNYYIYVDSYNVQNVSISYTNTVYDHNFDSKHIVDIGYVEAGDTVYVNVPVYNGNSGYIDIFLSGLNEEGFIDGYNKLKAEQLEITSFEETCIKGKVTAKEDSVFYTSIPYDESWQVYIDGKRVSENELSNCKIGNGLLGFYISEGTHDIELRYEARGLKIGIIITVSTTALLILILIVLRKKKPIAGILEGYSDTENVTVISESDIQTNSNTPKQNK